MASERKRDPDQPPQPVARERSMTDNARLAGAGLLVLALLVFFAQNMDDAQISFLWFDWEIPLFLALVLSALLGGLITWLLATLRGRGERKRQEAMFESAMREAKR
jgi:uncharacterized integral membrane protein